MRKKPLPLLFLSHIVEEAELATLIKDRIQGDFLGQFDVFQSSDYRSLASGTSWLKSIDDALNRAYIMLVLCSSESVKRPWINFEAGAGAGRGIRVIPICHSGMGAGRLPSPLNSFQASNAVTEEQWQAIYYSIAQGLETTAPSVSFTDFIQRIMSFESEYGFRFNVITSVSAIIRAKPFLRELFDPSVPKWSAKVMCEEQTRDVILPHLKTLSDHDLLEFSFGATIMKLGMGGQQGTRQEEVINISLKTSYQSIAEETFTKLGSILATCK